MLKLEEVLAVKVVKVEEVEGMVEVMVEVVIVEVEVIVVAAVAAAPEALTDGAETHELVITCS